MTSLLSPQAKPFEPTYWTIYNDGIPVVTMRTGSESEILHGIADEAIDEVFPPSAQEAAEIDAVEVFVDMLATLAILEEHEEATRNEHAGMGKRWEARRELHGKPRPAAHRVEPELHGEHHAATTELVSRRHDSKLNRTQQAKAVAAMHNLTQSPKSPVSPRKVKPIQQPRKQS